MTHSSSVISFLLHSRFVVYVIKHLMQQIKLYLEFAFSSSISAAFYTFEHTHDSLAKLQAYHSQWPTLTLSWSFICVFAGLLLNIISTIVFLSILLIKGEHKASRSSKGLSPTHVVDTNDKTPIVSVISGNHTYENEAYAREFQNDSNTKSSRTDIASASYEASDLINDETDTVLNDDNKGGKSVTDLNDFSKGFVPCEPFTDLDAVESENEAEENEHGASIATITESIHL